MADLGSGLTDIIHAMRIVDEFHIHTDALRQEYDMVRTRSM